MCFLPTLLLLFLSTSTTSTAFPFAQSNGDDSSSLVAQILYSNNEENKNDNVLQISGNNQYANRKSIACKSDSGGSLEFSIGKREVEMCPPSPEIIPDKQPAPAEPIFDDKPLGFTSPEGLFPSITEPGPDDEKCPTRLMKTSRIPVCDSGMRRQDLMRLPGEQTYTLFNIRPYSDLDPCVRPCKPWCCAATGSQIHPLFPLDPPVPTGYICRNIDYQFIFQDYDPLAHPRTDDPGVWPRFE